MLNNNNESAIIPNAGTSLPTLLTTSLNYDGTVANTDSIQQGSAKFGNATVISLSDSDAQGDEDSTETGSNPDSPRRRIDTDCVTDNVFRCRIHTEEASPGSKVQRYADSRNLHAAFLFAREHVVAHRPWMPEGQKTETLKAHFSSGGKKQLNASNNEKTQLNEAKGERNNSPSDQEQKSEQRVGTLTEQQVQDESPRRLFRRKDSQRRTNENENTSAVTLNNNNFFSTSIAAKCEPDHLARQIEMAVREIREHRFDVDLGVRESGTNIWTRRKSRKPKTQNGQPGTSITFVHTSEECLDRSKNFVSDSDSHTKKTLLDQHTLKNATLVAVEIPKFGPNTEIPKTEIQNIGDSLPTQSKFNIRKSLLRRLSAPVFNVRENKERKEKSVLFACIQCLPDKDLNLDYYDSWDNDDFWTGGLGSSGLDSAESREGSSVQREIGQGNISQADTSQAVISQEGNTIADPLPEDSNERDSIPPSPREGLLSGKQESKENPTKTLLGSRRVSRMVDNIAGNITDSFRKLRRQTVESRISFLQVES